MSTYSIVAKDSNYSGESSELEVEVTRKQTAEWSHNGYDWRLEMVTHDQDSYDAKRNERWMSVSLYGSDWDEGKIPMHSSIIVVDDGKDYAIQAVRIMHAWISNHV